MTRVTIETVGGTHESLVLTNRSQLFLTPDQDGWWLQGDGLGDEWYSPPESRAEVEDNPTDDGGYWPDEYLLSAKSFPLRGTFWSTASSLGQAAARAKLARLHNRPLSILVEDEAGERWMYGFIRQAPVIKRPNIWSVDFSLVIHCPKPVKVGREARFPVAAGVARVENSGDYPSWPMIYVQGQVTSLVVQETGGGSGLIGWTGNANGLLFDPQTGIMLDGSGQEIGGVEVDDVFKIQPGAHDVLVSTNGTAQVGVRPAWI